MRDDICTIPVSEVFEPKDGCPLCRMHDTVEKRITDYILGDAMMEPDVRIATNESGFCAEHYDKMAARRGRLQLALMLETHVQQVERECLVSTVPFEANCNGLCSSYDKQQLFGKECRG